MSTLVNTESGEIVEAISEADARRLTERIRITASNYAETKAKLLQLVDEAKAGAAHLALGYKSWTAYLSDVLSDEPLRLARDDRRELSVRLSEEGMSTRAIAPIVGAGHVTVARDIASSTVPNETVDEPQVRETEGLDGRVRLTVVAQPAPPVKPRRRPLPDVARDAGWDLRKSVERIERIAADDRFSANAEQVTPHLRSHLQHAIEVCQDLLDRINENN